MRLRPLNRGLALLAVTALALLGAQTAGAQAPTGTNPPTGQQPPTGDQPPSGNQPPGGTLPRVAQSADVGITLSGSGGGSRVEEGETYRWEAVVKNHGPGVARGVKVIVSPPEDFDLDKTNHEAECETNPGAEGRMVCSYGDLASGAEFTLKFSGQFRDNKRFRTHVFVESTTTDPDPTNNNDKQRFKVHKKDRPEPVGDALACGSGPVRLVGGNQSGGFPDSEGDGIDVASDLEVRLNDETIFEDDNGFPQLNGQPPPFGPLDPVEFQAEDGDELRIIARTGFQPFSFLDPLTLQCSDGREQKLTDGEDFQGQGSFSTFFDEEFVIALGGP